MHFKREKREFDNLEEVTVYNLDVSKLYTPSEKTFNVTPIVYENVIKNIPSNINIFRPYNNGEDFIIERLGHEVLQNMKIAQKDVSGKLLSETSEIFYEILFDPLNEVYKSKKSKDLRIFYYIDDRLSSLSNICIIYDNERLFVISYHRYNLSNTIHSTIGKAPSPEEEGKAHLIEYFTQSGNFYKYKGKYIWSQGIYNIINRAAEETDELYNIVLSLTVPEDRDIVAEILNKMDAGVENAECVMRIQTNDGIVKCLEFTLHTKYDEKGRIIAHYGNFKDVSENASENYTRPVDYLLNGFKHSKRLALLVEPLNEKNFEFSAGFYNIIEIPKLEYKNNTQILDNIVETEAKDKFLKIINGEITEFNETFTYNVNGDVNNKKICEMYIERFDFGRETHSMGFLTDITKEMKKQKELINANEHKNVLIKEVHHRVKNNLQILNSFLNLERRAYKDQPEIILDHMQSRLSSLAILHEKTYNTTDFKNINLKSYIDDQDGHLKSLIGLRDGIEFESIIEPDIDLSIEVITPLLLVIDELTMNSIKHAFPDKSKHDKKIIKEIKKIDTDTCELIIRDNGVGISKDAQKPKHNLGCEIIKNLTRQLNGKIERIDTGVGTGFRLTFPMTMKHTISQ